LIEKLQVEVAEFDSQFWDHEPGFETIRHAALHLTKLAGKLATYCEAVEHGESPSLAVLEDEVNPDLVMFAARLSNNSNDSLEESYRTRKAALEQRFS